MSIQKSIEKKLDEIGEQIFFETNQSQKEISLENLSSFQWKFAKNFLKKVKINMSELSTLLLEWFDLNKRILPFRKNNKPYDVWVSEIMLQQTKVDTVIPYYNAWMKKFPTIKSVSEASEESIFKVLGRLRLLFKI